VASGHLNGEGTQSEETQRSGGRYHPAWSGEPAARRGKLPLTYYSCEGPFGHFFGAFAPGTVRRCNSERRVWLQPRTGLCRHSNQSLSATGNSAGKKSGEARDRGGIFGGTGRFRTTETALSRVSGQQSRGMLKTIPTAPGNRSCAGLRGGAGRTRNRSQAIMRRYTEPWLSPNVALGVFRKLDVHRSSAEHGRTQVN
jgi:hypothetical protein